MGFSAQGMVEIIKTLGNNIIGCEIGVDRGNNIKCLLDICSNVRKIYAIDPWAEYTDQVFYPGAERERRYHETLVNLRSYIFDDCVDILRMPSLKAVDLFPDGYFDFVYIDGDHSYKACLDDCRAWWPKVKPGQILSGHDFRAKDTDVREAVYKFASEVNKSVVEAEYISWYIRKS